MDVNIDMENVKGNLDVTKDNKPQGNDVFDFSTFVIFYYTVSIFYERS